MRRTTLIIAILIAATSTTRPSQDVYPRLTRETLIGAWEGVFGIGAHPMIFHIAVAPEDKDSYLSEFAPDSMRGGIFHMDSCTVIAGKVRLHFRSVLPGSDAGWWFEGEGFGDSRRAWINAHFGTDLDKPRSGPPTFYLEKGTWIRSLGEASVRAAEDITKFRDGKK
jgi:hypothetical protein